MSWYQGADDVGGTVGFACDRPMPPDFEKYRVAKLRQRPYLRTLARARLAIYQPGIIESISFKLGQYLALGLPMIGTRPRRQVDRILAMPGLADQLAFETPVEIAVACRSLLDDPDRLASYSASNAATHPNPPNANRTPCSASIPRESVNDSHFVAII